MKLEYYNNHLESIVRWNFNTLLSFVNSHIVSYPTPIALNYAWSFGSMAGLCLGIQILSGVFLAMHYTPHVDYAFASYGSILSAVAFIFFFYLVYDALTSTQKYTQ